MRRYVAGRILWGLVLVLAVSLVIFAIFYLLPAGDPAVTRAGKNATPDQIEAVRQSLGLDRSLLVQYGVFVENLVLHQDLGYSYESGVSVNDLIADRMPATLWLVAGSLVIWLGVGVVAGVLSAGRPGSWFDRVVGVLSLGVMSTPVFLLGYVALLLFAVEAGSLIPVLPGVGAYIGAESFGAKLAALVLPCFVLGLSLAGIYARLTRVTVGEEYRRQHVVAATSRGLGPQRVLWGHATRTGMAPVLTLFGIDLGLILGGNVVLVETVFNVPGVGSLLISAVDDSDIPVIQGITFLAAIFVVAANILVDVIYASLDPRVRLGRE